MSKCVFRTDLRDRPVGAPLLCIDAVEMFFRPGMPTVEQCVRLLLTDEEICLGVSERRAIMLGARVVGYIRIVEERDWAPARRSAETPAGGESC
jgi:hypothetical protein